MSDRDDQLRLFRSLRRASSSKAWAGDGTPADPVGDLNRAIAQMDADALARARAASSRPANVVDFVPPGDADVVDLETIRRRRRGFFA